MEVYDSRDGHMDLLLAQMYQRIVDAGEMGTIYAAPHTLSSFLHSFQAPNSLVFECDDEGIFFAAWFEPTFSGAFFSVWIRPDRRQSREAMMAFMRAAEAGFQLFSNLLGVTKQADLLPIHRKMGYTLKCKIPGLFGGHDAFVVELDRKKFNRKLKKVKTWAAAAQKRADCQTPCKD